MPAINAVKPYRANAYYHVYNRGAHKADIFLDDEDYFRFGHMLRHLVKQLPVHIQAYAVMPNHYHFLLYQQKTGSMEQCMKSLAIRYSLYMREKYGHSGAVFQGRYKAVLRRGRNQIHETENYILRNPEKAGLTDWKYVGRNVFFYGANLIPIVIRDKPVTPVRMKRSSCSEEDDSLLEESSWLETNGLRGGSA